MTRLCERRKSQEFCEKAYDKIEEAKDKTKEVVREHPLESIAVAAVVGAVAGVAVSEGIRAVMRRRA